MARLQTY